MELREVLTRCAELWIEREKTRPKGVKLPLSDKEIRQFLEDAQSRDDSQALWSQIDDLLNSLQLMFPLRVSKMRRELKWLRKQAYKNNLTWGRK